MFLRFQIFYFLLSLLYLLFYRLNLFIVNFNFFQNCEFTVHNWFQKFLVANLELWVRKIQLIRNLFNLRHFVFLWLNLKQNFVLKRKIFENSLCPLLACEIKKTNDHLLNELFNSHSVQFVLICDRHLFHLLNHLIKHHSSLLFAELYPFQIKI